MQKAKEMREAMKEEFHATILSSSWLSEHVKEALILKANMMRVRNGYENIHMKEEEMEAFYKNLDWEEDSEKMTFLMMEDMFVTIAKNAEFKYLNDTTDRADDYFETYVGSMGHGAFYAREFNMIALEVDLMQEYRCALGFRFATNLIPQELRGLRELRATRQEFRITVGDKDGAFVIMPRDLDKAQEKVKVPHPGAIESDGGLRQASGYRTYAMVACRRNVDRIIFIEKCVYTTYHKPVDARKATWKSVKAVLNLRAHHRRRMQERTQVTIPSRGVIGKGSNLTMKR
ncbi:hypothetical protein Y032_0001g373 [Ancylostoma ceylanicum]|nr:hypothetical protein Y032_0001g373 [Ancylostoma ceylanicum]